MGQTANSQEPCSLSVLGLKILTLCDSLCSRSSSRTESPCKGSSPREMTLEPNRWRDGCIISILVDGRVIWIVSIDPQFLTTITALPSKESMCPWEATEWSGTNIKSSWDWLISIPNFPKLSQLQDHHNILCKTIPQLNLSPGKFALLNLVLVEGAVVALLYNCWPVSVPWMKKSW